MTEDTISKVVPTLSPPDGGLRAYLVVVSSFLCNGIIFGLINTSSVIYVKFYETMVADGLSNASSKASLIGSLTMGMTFLLSPVAGILMDRIGIQTTVFSGCMLAALGIFLSSLLTSMTEWLFLTYGIMFGVGVSFIYTPTLTILGHYFKKYLGLVNGLVTSGSALFTIIMPYARTALLNESLVICLRTEALIVCVLSLSSFAFKPLYKSTRQSRLNLNKKFRLSNFINTDIWKNQKFVIWIISMPTAMLGYFVLYVHLTKYVKDNYPADDFKLPIVFMAVAAGIGKLIFGPFSDYKKVDGIILQQFSFLVIGLMTILVPFISSYRIVLIICFIMGIFDGCFVSVIGPIAFNLCGPEGASQAIGFLFGFCSLPLMAGPPIAGMIYDHTMSYTIPFIFAGIPPLIAVVMLSTLRFVDKGIAENSEVRMDML